MKKEILEDIEFICYYDETETYITEISKENTIKLLKKIFQADEIDLKED